MPNASFLQSSFLGGIWAPSAQGRMHDPAYKTALNECLNSFPTEEGAWQRRPGFRHIQHTRGGVKGVLRAFDFTITQPFQVEFTAGWLRFFQGLDLVKTNDGDVFVSGISTATPAMVACAGPLPSGWANGDTVMFTLQNVPCGPQAVLCNRQFTIQNANTSAGTFTLKDPISGDDIDGALIGYVTGAALDKVQKVFELATPYTLDELDQLRILSDDSTVLILHPAHQPRVISVGVTPYPFAIAVQDFEDGPWLDINTTTTTLTLSGSTGSVTVTASAATGINGGLGFQATDVGRQIRFQGGPPLWASGTGYSKGNQVTGSDGNIYVAQGGMTGLDPTLDDGTHWVVSSSHVNWIWLEITARTDATHVTADVKSDLRGAGTFAEVQGNGNLYAFIGTTGHAAIAATYPGVDMTQIFSPGQSVAVTDGAFTDGGGGDISGTYTVLTPGLETDLNRSYVAFTDEDGATAGWSVISGLSGQKTGFYSPSIGTNLAGDELSTTVWRLGAYSDTTGWPACGAYHEGRRWLTGEASNRVDASMSPQDGTEDNFNKFSPTGADGTVADDSAVAAIANADELNTFFWMLSGEYGLLLGTQAGEWLLRASALDDPISDSSIQMRRVSKYGCANIEPQFCTRTTAFVQRQGRRVLDIANYPYGETAGWYADNLSRLSDSLTGPGIAEIRYQQTPTWNLWMRDNDGGLIGSVFCHAAYGKDSFNGWHRHEHGGGRTFVSIATGPSFDGLSDTLYAVTNQTDANAPDFGIHWVECLSPLFDAAADECSAFHADGGVVPCCTELTGTAPNFTGLTIYGLWHLNGQTVQPFLGGLDLGDYTVANGSISITFADASKGHDAALFTLAYFQSLATCDQTGAETGFITTTAVVNPNVGDLEAFVAPGTNVTYESGGGIFHTDPDLPYVLGVQNGAFGNTGGLQVFNRNTTGDEASESTEEDIFGSGQTDVMIVNSMPSRVHPNGVYYVLSALANHSTIACIRIADQVLLGTFGIAGSGFGSDATHLAAPFDLCPVVKGTANYMITAGEIAAGFIQECAVWDLSTGVFVFVEKTDFSDTVIHVCEGLRGRGDYYVMGNTFYIGTSTVPITLYECWVPSSTGRQICSLAPADIDPTWTHTAGTSGPGFDAADNNPLFFVGTTDTVTHQNYLVKVDRLTGAVLWTSPVASTPPLDCQLARCNLNGTLQIFDDGAHNVITIDLSDGSQTTTAWNAGITVGNQWYDCSSASIFTIGSYNHSTGPTPTLIGEWFGSNASVSTRVMEIYSGADLEADSETTTYDFYGCVGLTYNSDVQLLRPDFGQDAGTQAGPAFGKKRRIHKMALGLVRSRGLSYGTDFTRLDTVPLKDAGGTDIAAPALFSGTVAASDMTINDDYGTTSQICLRVSRPYPALVTAVAGMIEAQDE